MGKKTSNDLKIPWSLFAYLVELDTVEDEYRSLSYKSLGMLDYVHKSQMNKFDWMIKADDDSYVIMDNLKWFLSSRCDRQTETYGQMLKYGSSTNKYLSGGAGYVLSAEAVRRGRARSAPADWETFRARSKPPECPPRGRWLRQ